ncbi:DarT ssDNA thymidine ADP-ribosyltransferase family protein [Sulfurospirillum multivorans]|uniref:DarT domain-containing protein n=2 Tax=Sulfurospirillum multivorans TaxID=66821 RepID=A0AA86DYZ0_SULMK|nr:DarT ssDNA thymidine ADP-ribosyltransferase family protein [Sulfurospirillum multivorans]AHJ13793.1 hypothetical protein SMUL_2551 [Sulfurospirillum multivorans DSM 12446]QEH07283.1 hypothetical protein SMN_2527 [Sulfurospirillum multivorans]
MNKEQFLDTFQTALAAQFAGTQNWWSKSLFHFTDVTNAISVLNHGKIYSREKAIATGLMRNDNANDGVIAFTSDEHKKYARLYFGPTTPTQRNNEGIKPKDLVTNNAHCPIPIMFVFDFKKIFLLNDTKFTDGNLATNPNIYDDIKDLDKLNFHLIYHRSWFNPEDRNTIINARHSEVLIKDELSLENNLRFIAVRSVAEKELLLYQLSDELKEKYQNKIYVQPQTGIFTNDWIYVDSVSKINNQLHINWHMCASSSRCTNKYDLNFEAKNLTTNEIKTIERRNWYPEATVSKINLTDKFLYQPFTLSIYIDDIKAYYNILGELI